MFYVVQLVSFDNYTFAKLAYDIRNEPSGMRWDCARGAPCTSGRLSIELKQVCPIHKVCAITNDDPRVLSTLDATKAISPVAVDGCQVVQIRCKADTRPNQPANCTQFEPDPASARYAARAFFWRTKPKCRQGAQSVVRAFGVRVHLRHVLVVFA